MITARHHWLGGAALALFVGWALPVLCRIGIGAAAAPSRGSESVYLGPNLTTGDREALAGAIRLCLAELDADPDLGVTFVSGESRGHDGARVINRIWRLEAASRDPGKFRLDAWCMEQRRATESLDRAALLGLVVKNSPADGAPKIANFLQLKRSASGNLKVVAPQAPCLMCHSNGPRAIRPEYVDGLAVPDERGRAMIKAWNITIARMGEVQGFDPRSGGIKSAAPLHLLPGGGGELTLGACVDCHKAGSGIRGPLRLENRDSIEFLVKRGFDHEGWWREAGRPEVAMPRERGELSSGERECLQAWSSSGELPAQCRPPGVGRLRGEKHLVQVLASDETVGFLSLRIGVSTTLGGFTIKDIGGAINFDQKNGGVTGHLDLSAASTGSDLRDRHMGEKVIGGATRIAVTGRMDSVGRGSVQLLWKGKVVTMPLSWTCEPHQARTPEAGCGCRSSPISIDLSGFGLKMPSVLWAEVLPVVHVTGHFEGKTCASSKGTQELVSSSPP